MLEKVELGQGFPEWTELGQETGLDPLGMQRPIELVFQFLLSGISTITLRLRYYSFFAWMLEAYAKREVITTDYEAFRSFQRRAEALYALICARDNSERGVAGIEWATKTLAATNSDIDFGEAAAANADESLRYLKNKGGAFGGIYASQMREMGLVKLEKANLPIPFCTDVALPVVAGFRDVLGGLEEHLLSAIESGHVSLEVLDKLATVRPSAIQEGSLEQQYLGSVLMGRHNAASRGDLSRSQTLLMLLHLAKQLGRAPTTEEAKWAWFGGAFAADLDIPNTDQRQAWALYQASDLLRLGYENLLDASLSILNNSQGTRLSLQELSVELVELSAIADDVSFEDWLCNETEGNCLEDVAEGAATRMHEARIRGATQQQVKSALRLIAALVSKVHQFDETTLQRLGEVGHFQSLASEGVFLRSNEKALAKEVIFMLIRERILKRHIWVASKKFQNQKAYTFLFEPDEGGLRYRASFKVSPSSPRIDQAVQFLRDINFIDDGGITDFGLKELEQA